MRAIVSFALLTFAAPAHAGDWPQWLGPNRDGTTLEVIRPWKAEPKVLWRAPVGEGHSSPVVAGGEVYLHYKGPDADTETVGIFNSRGQCYKSKGYGPVQFTSPFGAGPRATPAVAADGTVISYGVTGILQASFLTGLSSGGLRNEGMAREFNVPVPKFGVAASPLIDGDRAIVMVGGKGASLVAYNRRAYERKSFQVIWKSLDDPPSYASPIITEHGGKRQLIALTGEAIVSLDPANGELFWRYPFRDAINESSTTPLRVNDMIIASSVTLGSVALKLTTKDGKPAVTEAWKNPALCCYFSTPLAVGDKYLYMVTGSLVAAMTNKPESALNCVEAATGKVLWTKPKVGKFHAALIRTGDNKLLMLSDFGDLTMIDPDPKEYRELARAKVCGETWAHPALANGRLYLRDNKELICLQLGN
jgi:outer membrane protein assembly factor BamB